MQEVNAFIIAGGKSSRMNQGPETAVAVADKAFLSLNGRFLIEHAIHQARVADDIYIVGPREKFSAYGRVVLDIFPDAGPLGGIHAALHRSRTDLNLILPVDLPFLKQEFLLYMLDLALKNSSIVTVPRMNGRLQPLCAVYRRDFVALAEASLKKGELKIDSLFPANATTYVDIGPELKPLGFETSMFDNINTPEDFERAAKRDAPQIKANQAHD